MARLNRGAKLLLEFLQANPSGTVVSRDGLMKAMKWKESTLKTYLTKNMLAPFLLHQPDGQFRVVKGGDAVRPEEVEVAFSQKKPLDLVLARGDVLQGQTDRYTLISPLGSGAVGHVWRAASKSTGAVVAVKIVNPRPDLLKPSVFDDVKRRFGREAVNARQLRHQCLISYLDDGEFRDHPFLTMELADNSVRDLLDSARSMTDSQAASIVAAVARGLQYLHAKGCVHRDIKPHNILQTARGFVVGDLGIARWDDLNPEFISAGTMTRESIQLGSWLYMPPEQQRTPHAVEPASDVYSLGITWYELLAGETPQPQAVVARDLPSLPTTEAVERAIHAMVSYRASERLPLDEVVRIAEAVVPG